MPTPHPHARHIRRGVHIPLHVRYNPRGYVDPGTIYVYVRPPLPYPGGTDQTPPGPPVEIDELAGLPSGFLYFINENGVFYTDKMGNLLIGAI